MAIEVRGDLIVEVTNQLYGRPLKGWIVLNYKKAGVPSRSDKDCGHYQTAREAFEAGFNLAEKLTRN